jgi:hypothetical protein
LDDPRHADSIALGDGFASRTMYLIEYLNPEKGRQPRRPLGEF